MKKFLLISIFTFLSIVSFAQSKFPKYYIERGDTLGLIISIDQAQKIDSDLELLDLLQERGIQCDSVIKKYLIVVDASERQIALLDLKIKNLEASVESKNAMVNNLKLQIENWKRDLLLCDQQAELKQKIISNQDLVIGNLKLQRKLTIVGGVLGTGIGFLFGFLSSK